MKKRVIKLREYLEKDAQIPYSLFDVCKYVSDESDNCYRTFSEKIRHRRIFHNLLISYPYQAKLIRLLYIDFLLVSKTIK